MATTIRAVFDGEVLRPERPIDLQPHKTYEITIERAVPTEAIHSADEYSLTRIAALATDLGVEDLATQDDHDAHRRIAGEKDGA